MSTHKLTLDRRQLIAKSLDAISAKGVLYGSQVHHASLDRDIDIIVLADRKSVEDIFRIVAHLQITLGQVLHVVVLSESDLTRNPSWLELIRRGVVLWES